MGSVYRPSFSGGSSGEKRPPRWLDCPRNGEMIDDTFVAFKTPLNEQYSVPQANLFTPEMFIAKMKEDKIDLGLWISLTFTERYYDATLLENHQIKYFHIECRGHGQPPTHEETQKFNIVCDKFLAKNPKKAIVVHCTHGFNRSGFMICSYLYEKREWPIDAAIKIFAEKRPPGIYKQSYLDELIERYGDPEDDEKITAPEKPIWCFEDVNGDLDDDGLTNGSRRDVESQDYVGGNNEFMEGVLGVYKVNDKSTYERVWTKCMQMCQWEVQPGRVKFPGCQPVSMDTTNIGRIRAEPYKVSWKADGCRYMMLIEEKDKIFFLARNQIAYQVDGLTFPRKDNLDEHIDNTLLDGEMVIDVDRNNRIPRFLIYDIISLRSRTVGALDFEKRYRLIQDELINPREHAKQKSKISREREPFGVRRKGFFDLAQTKVVLEMKLSHESDGLIFQPVLDPYICGPCDKVLKWKPPSHNSIDFRLSIIEERRQGMLPHRVGLLFVCDDSVKFGTIHVTNDLEKYNGKIIECTLDIEKRQWKVMRERTDKLTANTFNTANAVRRSMLYPVTKEMLLEFVQPKAFKRPPPP